MSTFRRISILTLLFGWLNHAFSLFALPFIDILAPVKVNALSYFDVSSKLGNFVELSRELNQIVYNPNIYLFRPLAEAVNVMILGMAVIAVIALVFPNCRVVKAVWMYHLIVIMITTLIMFRVNGYYGERMFMNPANNVFYLLGLMFTFTSSFRVKTVINEDVKKEGYIL